MNGTLIFVGKWSTLLAPLNGTSRVSEVCQLFGKLQGYGGNRTDIELAKALSRPPKSSISVRINKCLAESLALRKFKMTPEMLYPGFHQ